MDILFLLSQVLLTNIIARMARSLARWMLQDPLLASSESFAFLSSRLTKTYAYITELIPLL